MEFLKQNVMLPLVRRIGTAFAVYFVTSVSPFSDQAGMVAALVAFMGVYLDLLLSFMSRNKHLLNVPAQTPRKRMPRKAKDAANAG